MNRVFCTGDTHGQFKKISMLCYQEKTTIDDYIIICGDVGLNYRCNELDIPNKNHLSKLPITILCVHGNHEERPYNISSYKKVYNDDLECYVYIEEQYPNILFLEDGTFKLKEHLCLCIGGAYSVDKYYRIDRGYPWFSSEQLNNEEKKRILKILENKNSFFYIFSHTVPLKYERELEDLFLPSIDQSTVDKSMEEFLDKVEDRVNYKHWFFGHFHDHFDLTPNLTILYNDIIELNL